MSRRKPGWLTVYPSAGRVDLVLLEIGSERPVVTLLASVETNGDLAGTLVELRKRHDLAAYRNVLLLAGGDFQLLQVDAPTVPRNEWKDALRWKLKDTLEYPVTEAVFDVLDIPTEEFAPTRPRSAYVAVAQRSLLAARVELFNKAALPLAVLDIPETAQRNLAALFEEENRGIACIAFDEGGALLTVTFHGELYAARRIDAPLQQVVAADEERRFHIFERVALEAQRTLDAFDRQYSFMTISKLLLAPRPELLGLVDVLSANLYIPIEIMDLSQVLTFADDSSMVQPAEQSRLFFAIGAALRDEVPA